MFNELKEVKPLIHGQINLIKFIELNKFDNVYSKIFHIFVSSNLWRNKKCSISSD